MSEANDSLSARRSEYKKVWTALSATESSAKTHVSGTEDEAALTRSGIETANFLRENLGIDRADVVLEIGCGIGRVGKQLAPHCRRWIGCDVSPPMLKIAAERLRESKNVELVEISGHELKPIVDLSVDLVYCTVVFMHLEQWDRYNYVEEAFRVLRPGGKLFVDNVNLCSDEGWQIFQQHRQFKPAERPAHITECSTPQELQEYLKRAGFGEVETRVGGVWISVWGRKRI
jgi:ubiquinone/menaquinone biosynthesis C-methylase UbiE